MVVGSSAGRPKEATMNYGEFMKDVRERTGLDRSQAERAVRATLNTLAQRLAGGEPKDLASQLPEELKETVTFTTGAGEGVHWNAGEFVERVADREGAPPEPARDHVRAIFAALRDALTPGEFDDIATQLDHTYQALLPARAPAG
jgi:uncharacterized protein (DUF2267 family)